MPRLFYWVLWVGLGVYAFGFAPPDQGDTWALIQRLAQGQWQGINPLVVALFNLMGVWPLVYACVTLADGRGQRVPAWPFTLGAMAVGSFALLPYLGLRQPQPQFVGPVTPLLRCLDSRWTGVALTLGALALGRYGLGGGDWADFSHQWLTSRFIHVMGLDFVLLAVLFPVLLGDDLARRGLRSPVVFWAVSLVPLLGPLVYLCLRPPLHESSPRPAEPDHR